MVGPDGSGLPRVVVAAPASGHGKTTVATGLMAALRAAGHVVSGHKVGPDYIDPGYHALATGRPGRNLDPHLVGEDLLVPLLRHGASVPTPADLAVVEGVMGLFDGAIGRDGFASTAHVANALRAPVVLVVDVSAASRSVAAVVHGMATFDPSVRIAGVILNKAGSPRHADEVRTAVARTGVPVLGVLGRDDGIVAPSRHLGLVPADERPEAEASVRRLADRMARAVDLEAIVRIARGAPPLSGPAWDPATALGEAARPLADDAPVVAIAGGRAFTFRYAETEELLRAAGCRPVVFDPMHDERLPAGTRGLYLGGGFPQVHASGLTVNEPMRHALAAAVAAGVPTVAECAGLLYLCRSVDGSPMVGAIDAVARMSARLTLRYHAGAAPQDTLLARAGETVTGHEFHRTTIEPALPEFSLDPAGTGRPTVHASYVHTHWAGHPHLARRFAEAVRAAPVAPAVPTADPLRHHGDREVAGLVDLAVNVQQAPRPVWLDEALQRGLADATRYPDPTAARVALARQHSRRPDEVLPTAGAAEAFTLLARLRPWRHPVVVHPQFTEPEAALRAAGHDVRRVVLAAEDGFALDVRAVPEEADLVVVGNPTNPTGVRHPATTLAALAREGRTLVVDEAFMDAVPGEPDSLTARRLPGLVVVRSLTKTWAVPGIRAGYLLAEPTTVAALARLQPPWSVSAPALSAMEACSTADALAEADRRARAVGRDRARLEAGLAGLGLTTVPGSAAPFVLAHGPHGLRDRLRTEGFAVRRGDTFPGLGPEWLRIAVRDAATTDALLAALARCLDRADRVG